MDILSTLKNEASKLQQQLETVNSAIKALGGKNSVSRGGRKKKRHMSAARRRAIARAQRLRWKKIKAQK